ncbi:MAG TPA: DNA polymerase III subunit delta [Vicinamibacterales bacterium]|nr:DNA polymerase III subunit delta [Vicinamibacterales bacterium]
MALASQVRQQIARGTADPVYLLLGDDDAEIARLAADISSLVEDELRVFNVERMYAGEKTTTPASIVQACRQIPMMGERRVVVVVRGERLLKPKRRSREDPAEGDEDAEPPSDLDALTEYVQSPSPTTTLVIAAADIDKTRKAGKAIMKHATVVECWGLKPGKEARGSDLHQATRIAEQMVKKAVAEAGQVIEPAAARLVAERAGFDIVRLRGDIERLMLYTTGKPGITLADAREIVSAETANDDWAVTNAIQNGNAREALRQLALAFDAGAVSYQVLGQLAWFVRDKMNDPRRIPAAVEALFRTDLDLKSSGGDPRVLLERLVVELCRPPSPRGPAGP